MSCILSVSFSFIDIFGLQRGFKAAAFFVPGQAFLYQFSIHQICSRSLDYVNFALLYEVTHSHWSERRIKLSSQQSL